MKLGDIAHKIHGVVAVDHESREITKITSLEHADETSITFLSKETFYETAQKSRAAAILVKTGMQIPGKVVVEVADPYSAYAKIAQLFEDCEPLYGRTIHGSAVIDPTAHISEQVAIGPLSVIGDQCTIGQGTHIGAHCVIEKGVHIGNGCRIDSNVVIRRNCMIGSRVIIQSGSIIGSEGFGNALENGVWIRIPCFGIVVLEDDVEIGANCTIDRGNFEPTLIHKGCRIDNLVHIAHNVHIGAHTAIAAQAGISGSTQIGKHVWICGQAGFVGHITIGDGAFVGGQAGVSKDVLPGQKVTGYPARDIMKIRRIEAALQNLPQTVKEVKQLAKTVEAMKAEKE